jgi:hypothetical protein
LDRVQLSGDPEIDAFVSVNLVSFPAWDLLLFLNANPEVDLTLPELCAALARKGNDLEPAVRRCIASGIIEAHSDDSGVVRFRLTHDEAFRGLLARFVAAAASRETRLELVLHVMSRLIS